MNIRNVAIIAHVDHGKTTLVDALLKQSKTKLSKGSNETLVMDSNELEQERGITIFSKNASIIWQDTKINIIDTPGHADFGGEVERVLKMADGCLLLIDAKEGPMPQTRFVLKKALETKLRIIVVVNKIDKKDARIHYVLDKTLDLFLELGANDNIADFPIVYASAKEGKAGLSDNLNEMTDISPIFNTILKEIPQPSGNPDKPLQMLVTSTTSDAHKGRIAVGRIYNGFIEKGREVAHINRNNETRNYKLTSLMTFEGLEKVDVEKAQIGDIVAISGIPEITIGETIADISNPVALPLLKIEQPTIQVTIMVNNSPFAGREGQYKTSREIRARLYKELETDMALKVEDASAGSTGSLQASSAQGDPNGWRVSGRGELHLAILIERLRREGYEFQVARPKVIDRTVNGEKLTPYEQVFIEAPKDFSGVIMQKLGERRGELIDMNIENGTVFLEFVISTRAFFGYRSEFTTDTKGLGIINTMFYKYDKDNGYNNENTQGSLVVHESGITSLYGLINAQDRGNLFLGPAVEVYKGQVVGQHARPNDLNVNVCKTKQLSNMRSKGEGGMEHFNTPKIMDLEDSLEYIADDELVEVTPKNIRIRKTILDEVEARRKRSQGVI